MLLVVTPELGRSKGRGQTRYDPNPSTCRFSIAPTTASYKKHYPTETAKLPLLSMTRKVVSK